VEDGDMNCEMKGMIIGIRIIAPGDVDESDDGRGMVPDFIS
jgi:hypothetical protein